MLIDFNLNILVASVFKLILAFLLISTGQQVQVLVKNFAKCFEKSEFGHY